MPHNAKMDYIVMLKDFCIESGALFCAPTFKVISYVYKTIMKSQ